MTIVSLCFALSQNCLAQHWSSLDNVQLDGSSTILDFVIFGDSLFVCGGFQEINGEPTNGILVWDSVNVHTFTPEDAGGVGAMANFQGNLIFGGSFLHWNNLDNTVDIVGWDGMNFFSVGGGAQFPGAAFNVKEMMVFKDSLFIIDPGGGVGGFDDLNGIVGFDGENWFDPGGFTIFGPECMEVYKGELYVAGEFGYSWPDWLPVRNVARFDGTTWHDLNGGFANGRVWCMSKDEDHDMLYMGGSFSQSWDGVTAYRVIRWDGENWHSLGVPWLNDIILSMCFYRGQLYVSGVFTADQYGNPRNHILRWDGAQWQNLGDGLDGVAFKMQVFKDELYVGGQFNWVGDSTFLVNDVARWYMDPDSVTWGVPVYSPDKDDDNEQTTGFIERINEKDWKIFPNPTNGILHVEFSQVQSGAIVLTDLQGRQKQYITIDGHQSVDLNVSSYPAGEYLVNVVRDGSIVGTKRMVVK